MREIKFRAWNKIFKKMGSPKTFEEWCIFKAKEGQFFPEFHYESGEFANLILMQYTGLKDKNDKEIYEGDIVKDEFNDVHIVRMEKFHFAGYDDSCSGFGFMLNTADIDSIEVIGNIYDNPELLEVQNGEG